jgi:hypothetical protein
MPVLGKDMRGRYEHRVWQWNPSTYAPSKYRRGCEYEAFVPERIAGLEPVGDHEKCTEMITKSAQVSGVSQP